MTEPIDAWVARHLSAPGADRSVQDHEHPCPSRGCGDYLRRRGMDIPEGVECCVCYLRGLLEIDP